MWFLLVQPVVEVVVELLVVREVVVVAVLLVVAVGGDAVFVWTAHLMMAMAMAIMTLP